MLSINSNKINYIIFSGPRKTIPNDLNLIVTINNNSIKRTFQTKFLGIIIDEQLTWHPQIILVKNKLAKIISIIKKT